MSFKRYTLSDVTSNQFYQMPKFLFEGELKTSLSNDAKVLYSLLKDRHELSLKNNWVNKNNEVYLIFTREDMCNMLRCSQPTLRKAIEQLKKANLMDEERQGFNRPNLIYLNYYDVQTLKIQGVKEFYTPGCKDFSFKSEDNFHSGVKEPFSQDCKDFSPSNTNLNQTDFSNTDYQSIYHDGQNNVDEIDTIDEKEKIIKTVKENIEYDLCKQTQGEAEYIDNIVSVITDVLCSNSPTVHIGKEYKPRSVVESVYKNLTYEHIQYVCLCLSQTTTSIKNIRSYLITTLYNAPQTMDTYYSQRVKHDLNL